MGKSEKGGNDEVAEGARYIGRIGGWGCWGHPSLSPAQQSARRAVETAQSALDAQLEVYRSQLDAAAQAQTPVLKMPPLPSAVNECYAALVKAESDSKAADEAAAAPPPAATSTQETSAATDAQAN